MLKTVEKAKTLNNKYKIKEKVKENGKIAFEKAKEIDEKYKIGRRRRRGEHMKLIEEKFLSNKESVSKLPATPGKT